MSDSRVKQEYKELVRASGVRMIDSGLTVSTWGNISIKDPETQLLYITPSGMDYHSLTDDDIDVYELDGTKVEGTRRPSIELDLHLGVQKARKDVNAVVHTHPIFSTVFGCVGEDIPINIHDEAAQALGDTVRCCDYRLPGTVDLADEVVRKLGDKANACLIHSHGAVCVGADIDGAFKVSTVLEMVAEVYWRVRAMGGQYVPISDENVAAMQEFVKTKYGQY